MTQLACGSNKCHLSSNAFSHELRGTSSRNPGVASAGGAAGLCTDRDKKEKCAVRKENARWDCMLAGVTVLLVQSPD